MRFARAPSLRLAERLTSGALVVGVAVYACCVVAGSRGGDAGPLLVAGTFLGGIVCLLANREVPLAACFLSCALVAGALRGERALGLADLEFVVVEVDGARFDPASAPSLLTLEADLLRVRRVDAAVGAALGDTFAYAHVYATPRGETIGLYSRLPIACVDTTFVPGGGAMLRASLRADGAGRMVEVVSVTEEPNPGRTETLAPVALDRQPTVLFASAEGATGPGAAQGGSGRAAAPPRGFDRACGGIYFAGGLACMRTLVLREGGAYLGRSATFRSEPRPRPVATL